MMEFLQSQGTAARRRVPLHLVDATDGITPETGESAGQPQISKNGAAFGNTSATLTAIANGAYYVELTAAELDTAGFAIIRYKSANTAEAQVAIAVVPQLAEQAMLSYTQPTGFLAATFPGGTVANTTNITAATGVVLSGVTHTGAVIPTVSAVTGLTASNLDATVSSRMATYTQPTGFLAATFPGGTIANTTNITAGTISSVTDGVTLAASAIQAIWDAATTALTTVGSIGKLLVDNINATISSRMATYTQPTGFLAATFPGGTVANTTNITAATGVVLSGVTHTGAVIPTVSAVTGLTAANLDAAISTRATPAQVNTEVVDALAVDNYGEPGQNTPPATNTLAAKINYLYKLYLNKKEQTASTFSLYNNAGTIVDQKATLSDDGTTFTNGSIVSGP